MICGGNQQRDAPCLERRSIECRLEVRPVRYPRKHLADDGLRVVDVHLSGRQYFECRRELREIAVPVGWVMDYDGTDIGQDTSG